MRRFALGAFAAVVVLGHLAAAVVAPDTHLYEVAGVLHGNPETAVLGYEIQLTGVMMMNQSWSTSTDATGDFHFSSVPAGTYLLHVKNGYGIEVQQQLVEVHDGQFLDVQLPGRSPKDRPGGVVSLRELEHPPAPKAVAAAADGTRLARSGNVPKAVEKYRKAIEISPDYALAHSALAVQYIRLREYQPARAEISKSMEIRGQNPTDLCNLAYVDAVERRFPEAIGTLRTALRLNPGYAGAHFLLGSILVTEPATAAEGLQHLRQAAMEIPAARKLLESVAPPAP
ncbi:MAG TPA: tetratricopeptide repeat protein [Bryobacteraceae bacterium]|nr:tetratricopeptide repeat protein [Bryobacteraceae bacterium]